MYNFIVNIIELPAMDFFVFMLIFIVWFILVAALAQELFRFMFNRIRYVDVKKHTQSLNGRTDD